MLNILLQPNFYTKRAVIQTVNELNCQWINSRSLKPKSLYLTGWKQSDFPVLLYRFPFSVQFKSNPVVFQLLPESDTRVERKFRSIPFHAWNHMVPCTSMYGII